MQYTIQNNGKGTVMIRVIAPQGFASSFLAFFEQKNRENVPVIKSVSSSKDENYFTIIQQKAFVFFDDFRKEGLDVKTAISKTNYALKAVGIANVSYDITKQILSKSGRLHKKVIKIQ